MPTKSRGMREVGEREGGGRRPGGRSPVGECCVDLVARTCLARVRIVVLVYLMRAM